MLPMDGTTQTSPALLGHVSPRHAAEETTLLKQIHFLELEAAEPRRCFRKCGVQ